MEITHYNSGNLIVILAIVAAFIVLLFIILKRLLIYLSSILSATTIQTSIPTSKTIRIELDKPSIPKVIILNFKQSFGLYNGVITVLNSNIEVGRFVLPILPEYTGSFFGIWGKMFNRNILRYNSAVIIHVKKFDSDHPLILDLKLDTNVHDSLFKKTYQITDSDEISIVVRGCK